MILTGALVLVFLAIYGAAVVHAMAVLGLSRGQALVFAPLKLVYRIGDRPIRDARRAKAPVIYVVTHQSRLDPALMLALLPEDTLHILDPISATSAWLEPFRGVGRSIMFNAEHVFVSRRLVRVLKGKGRIAVYIPDAVEPETRAYRLFRAVSRIAMQADATIVPISVVGSRLLPFSLTPEQDAPRWLLPRLRIATLPAMTIAEMMATGPATSPSNALFDRVAELRVHAASGKGGLFAAVRDSAVRLGRDRPIIEDVLGGGAMSYRRVLMAARILGGRFARMTAPGEVVGVMLPNSNGIVMALLGLVSAGRTAAMINYTAGPANVTVAVETTLMRSVISSRAFVAKAGLDDIVKAVAEGGARLVWLEDLRDGISAFDKAMAWLFWRMPVARVRAEGPAVIMFTSGSEGLPKAVVLSHRNLVSNAMQVEARIAIGPADRLLNVLPLFHPYGLTGGLILPLLTGVKVLLYPSPLHYRLIPRAAAQFRPTFLIGADTFLSAYANTAKDSDFESLRFAVAGAEPVRAETRRVWQERFGVRILEGYGMTEASPVVSVNSATHGRDGTVGRPLPGIRIRLDPVEGIAEGGRLWLSGPNIMLGTMHADQPGVVRTLGNGWHDSGDIVSVDRDGFLTIRGRAKRFAKIAGEMISLSAVEMLVSGLWPEDRHAAVAVPDKRRGEKVVLVTTSAKADAASLRQHARKAGAAELMLPDRILAVDDIPMLATGKTDYAAVQKIVTDRLGQAEAA